MYLYIIDIVYKYIHAAEANLHAVWCLLRSSCWWVDHFDCRAVWNWEIVFPINTHTHSGCIRCHTGSKEWTAHCWQFLCAAESQAYNKNIYTYTYRHAFGIKLEIACGNGNGIAFFEHSANAALLRLSTGCLSRVL